MGPLRPLLLARPRRARSPLSLPPPPSLTPPRRPSLPPNKQVKDNKEKIKLNNQLPYLVGNIVEVRGTGRERGGGAASRARVADRPPPPPSLPT